MPRDDPTAEYFTPCAVAAVEIGPGGGELPDELRILVRTAGGELKRYANRGPAGLRERLRAKFGIAEPEELIGRTVTLAEVAAAVWT